MVAEREVREASGATLRATENGLLRLLRGVDHDRMHVLGGAGAILDLAADPAGLTFVVAENGLYCLLPKWT